jgi:hypothetical protein
MVYVAGAVVALGAGAAAAPALAGTPGTVTIATGGFPFLNVVGGGWSPRYSALYVDGSGAAHIAYISPSGTSVELCTVPAGGGACIDHSTLATPITGNPGSDDEGIDYLEYLQDGQGSDYLVVGGSSFDQASDSFFNTIEVFPPGQSGIVTDNDLDPGENGPALAASVMLEPDDSGIDVVGDLTDPALFPVNPCCGDYSTSSDAYEFQSFDDTATAPDFFGSTNVCDLSQAECNLSPWAIAVTKLPQGQTAVLLDRYGPGFEHGADAIEMAVQPAAGGSFGPLRPLGITEQGTPYGVLPTFSASGDSYILNPGATSPTDQDFRRPLELYRFRATNLVPVATVGETSGGAADATDYEDQLGNLVVTWYGGSGEDGCPGKIGTAGAPQYNCLMYRRIVTGGLLGPKVVLSTVAFDTPLSGLGQVAANSQGAGWVLLGQGAGPDKYSYTLVAQPLVSSATATPPSVSGSTVTDSVACAGSPRTSCLVQGSLGGGGAGKPQDPGLAAAARARTSGYGSVTKRIKGGAKARLVLRLDMAGRKLLGRHHRLTTKLLVTETVGAVKTPTTVLSQSVSFGGRRK